MSKIVRYQINENSIPWHYSQVQSAKVPQTLTIYVPFGALSEEPYDEANKLQPKHSSSKQENERHQKMHFQNRTLSKFATVSRLKQFSRNHVKEE